MWDRTPSCTSRESISTASSPAKETYEIISPEDIGKKPSKVVLGKHSGRHAFEERLSELGFVLTKEQLDEYFERFKEICDKKKEVNDHDLEALISSKNVAGVYELDRFDVHTGNFTSPVCVMRLKRDGKVYEEVSLGDGPINAAYGAVDKIMKLPPHTLEKYTIRATSQGGENARRGYSQDLRATGRPITDAGFLRILLSPVFSPIFTRRISLCRSGD